MKALGYAAKQAKAPLTHYSFERREPKDNDVVIDIQYCGICHTDMHQVNDEWGGNPTYPMVPGARDHRHSEGTWLYGQTLRGGRLSRCWLLL